MNRPILAIVGPTCTGKTRLAVALAQRLAPADLLNADSRQLRRGTRVATFAPTDAELQGVPCHLLDLAGPGEPVNVAQWLRAARGTLAVLDAHHVRAILVGGSGLYVRALIDRYDLGGVAPDAARRAARELLAAAPGGRERLARELAERDPAAPAAVDMRNPRRVIRALEILDAAPGPLSAARRRLDPRDAVLIGLDAAPAAHRVWVWDRLERIFADGSVAAEVGSLLSGGVPRDALARSGIGYREALDVLDGRCTVAAALDSAVQRTLRYAKAQRTWFRHEARVTWLRADRLPFSELVTAAAALADCASA